MEDPLDRLKKLTSKISSYELTRKENYKRLKELFFELEYDKKIGDFEKIFKYKAINLLGISLQKENFKEIQEKKYFQILAITKVDNKTKNISLGYYGRVEMVEKELIDKVVEFVIRYRFEKSFMNVEYYYDILKEIDKKDV